MFTNFRLEDLYNQVEAEIKLDMSSACMPAISLQELAALKPELENEIVATIMKTKLGYSSQYGSEASLQAIRNLYRLDYFTDLRNDIMLTSGASEAIFLVMSTLFEAGDSIMVQQPIYQSLYQVAADRGVKIIDWNLECHCEESGSSTSQSHWSITKLENLIKANPKCKALVINNPNNPAGLGFNADDLNQISKLLEDRILISDEVFLFISQSQLPSALEHHHKAIVISDLSKSFNMPGLRLGWILCSKATSHELSAMSSFKNYLSLRTNTLSEALTPLVLELAPELCRRNRELVKNNIDLIYSQEQEIFDLSQITRDKIEGLCVFPLVKNPELVDHLWHKNKTFLVKGEYFGHNWSKHLRVGLKKIPELALYT